jgi:RecB family endonuclease NucS
MSTESDLEKLLVCHPYLIDEEFAGLHPLRQLTCGKHRLDLAFELTHGLCIVELKKTPLTVADVRQLSRYCRVWSRRPLAKYHYLIGKRPRDESGLRKAVLNCQFEIKTLYIDEHIPTLLA